MNSKLVRSSSPHSVAFNEVTRNAISPKNDLKSGDKKQVAGVDKTLIGSEQLPDAARVKFEDEKKLSSLNAKFDTEAISDQTSTGISKSPIRTNRQHLDVQNPLDAHQFQEAVQRLEDRIQHFKATHHTDNRQTFTDDALVDNRQTFAEDVLRDNMQLVPSHSAYENHKVYLEKKNIRDQLVHVQTSESIAESDQMKLQVEDEAASAMAQKNSNSPVPANQEPLEMVEEDPLQAQIRLMKKKLRKANQTLVEIQAQDSAQQD